MPMVAEVSLECARRFMRNWNLAELSWLRVRRIVCKIVGLRILLNFQILVYAFRRIF